MESELQKTHKLQNFKILIPQIFAAFTASSSCIAMSLGLAFSTYLIPYLEDPQSEIKVTTNQSSLTASIVPFSIIFASLLTGFSINKIGNLNTLKLGSFPSVAGWVMVATATNIYILLFGRFLSGFGSSILYNASETYVTEIARHDLRGLFLISLPGFVSVGFLVMYLQGFFLHWRIIAWISNTFIVIPVALVMFLPESPLWLISKGRLNEAKQSLKQFNRFCPNPEDETNKQFLDLIRNTKEIADNKPSKANSENKIYSIVREFKKPTGYRPILLTTALFFFQEFSGIYIVLLNAVIFFRKFGSNFDERLVPILLGTIRVLMSIISMWTIKKFNRRPLMILSSGCMAVSMVTSGIFTLQIEAGVTMAQWVPLICLLTYMSSAMLGMVPIPWIIIGELFPTKIRGFGQGICAAIGNILMSVAVQSYRNLEQLLGGSYAIQLFFAGVSFFGCIFFWIFLPEIQNKKLYEIEEYFENNFVYLTSKKQVKKIDKNEVTIEMIENGR